MSWSTIAVVFVIIFAIFNTQQPIPSAVSSSSNQASYSEETSYEIKEQLDQSTPSLDANDMEAYQVIVSFIIEIYKGIPMEDAFLIAEHTIRNCKKYGMDPFLMTALYSVESSFNKMAVSSSGALGLGQLMPFNVKSYKVNEPFDIEQNIRGSVRMIYDMLSMWNNDVPHALASYYEGHNAIKRKYGQPFKQDTQAYVNKILSRYETLKSY